MTQAFVIEKGLTLITGASSGIGEALARVFAANGHEFILAGRSHERLATLADEIERQTGRRPAIIAQDLSAKGAGIALAGNLAQMSLTPRFIVNSAGSGLFGRADRLSIEAQTALIEINCGALTEVTLALLPGAIAQRGGVLNVGSVGGFFPGPGMAVYFATKAYVQSFSQGLRAEYNGTGLRICALCPGPVTTRFQCARAHDSAGNPRALASPHRRHRARRISRDDAQSRGSRTRIFQHADGAVGGTYFPPRLHPFCPAISFRPAAPGRHA